MFSSTYIFPSNPGFGTIGKSRGHYHFRMTHSFSYKSLLCLCAEKWGLQNKTKNHYIKEEALASVSQATSYKDKGGLNSIPYLELFEDILDVGFNGFFADEKRFPDILICVTLWDKTQDFHFTVA